MHQRFAWLMLTLPLAACGGEAKSPAPKQTISVRSDGQAQMHRLNDVSRAIALKRAIYDTGAACLRVTRSGYVGKYENTEQWTATCEDKYKRNRDWALYVGPDDSVQVRLCDDVVKAGLPACVIKTGDGPAAAAS